VNDDVATCKIGDNFILGTIGERGHSEASDKDGRIEGPPARKRAASRGAK
jgi:hypothetical protein